MDSRPPDGPPTDGADDRCDFCRHPITRDTVDLEHEGDSYGFCSHACRDALLDSDYVFTEYHGDKRFHPGVSALDGHLPQGIPRNAFILLSGDAGTRDRAVHAELVWRTLERGEPAIFVTFQEPPGSVVQQFLTLGWNVLPYLEAGQLYIVDCFTYRVDNRERMFERLNDWNRHLYRIAETATVTVRDPTDFGELENKLDNCLEAHEMVDRGAVLIDSLTEIGSLVQPVQAYNLVKDIRADVCKGRFVPIFAGATHVQDEVGFPHDLEYMVDGVVDMRLNESIVPNTLIKQIRIRKMSGVLVIPQWSAYEYTAGEGLVAFDPEEEIEKSRDAPGTDESDRERPEPESGGSAEPDSETDVVTESATAEGFVASNRDANPEDEAKSEGRRPDRR